MAKSISHNALDAALAYIAARADRLALLSGVPASAGEAVTPLGEDGRMLALAELTPGLGNGDFALADAEASGRRLMVGGCDHVPVLATGVADHLALVASASGELLVVTALAGALELVEHGVVSVAAFSHDIADPV